MSEVAVSNNLPASLNKMASALRQSATQTSGGGMLIYVAVKASGSTAPTLRKLKRLRPGQLILSASSTGLSPGALASAGTAA